MCALELLQKNSIPVTESGCWLWTNSTGRDGYGKISIQGKTIRAHRWSWEIHKGYSPGQLQVLHRCDVPLCVNPDHLFLGTNQDNVRDRELKGRGHKMPIHRETKISEDDAKIIISLKGKVRIVDLAERFGIHYTQVSRIQNGRFWKHLSTTERMG
jgi:hypothetical protein